MNEPIKSLTVNRSLIMQIDARNYKTTSGIVTKLQWGQGRVWIWMLTSSLTKKNWAASPNSKRHGSTWAPTGGSRGSVALAETTLYPCSSHSWWGSLALNLLRFLKHNLRPLTVKRLTFDFTAPWNHLLVHVRVMSKIFVSWSWLAFASKLDTFSWPLQLQGLTRIYVPCRWHGLPDKL